MFRNILSGCILCGVLVGCSSKNLKPRHLYVDHALIGKSRGDVLAELEFKFREIVWDQSVGYWERYTDDSGGNVVLYFTRRYRPDWALDDNFDIHFLRLSKSDRLIQIYDNL
jgi:hypothetical protein